MRIIVCLKQIRHTYARTGMDPDMFYIAAEDNIFRINPYDETALEIALCIKDIDPGAEIIILTLGPLIAEKELRRCYAMGADEIYRIEVNGEPDSWQKSFFLARAIKEIKADLILCGKESLDKQNGKTGALLAYHLGLPFVSAILDLKIKEKGRAEMIKSAGRGIRELISSPLPAVFSVDMGLHEPRFPDYAGRKKALEVNIRKLSYPSAKAIKKIESAGISQIRPRPKDAPAPDCKLPSFDRVMELLTGSRIEKKGTILSGSPESQADGIIEFLEEHGFIKSPRC